MTNGRHFERVAQGGTGSFQSNRRPSDPRDFADRNLTLERLNVPGAKANQFVVHVLPKVAEQPASAAKRSPTKQLLFSFVISDAMLMMR
jgi:hypothetical protein